MISDAHNDIITSGKNLSEIVKYLSSISVENELAVLTLVLWTSKLTQYSAHRVASLLAPFDALFCNFKTVLGIEDLNFASISDVELLKKNNIFYASLTWNFDNKFAGGALGGGRLTRLGKEMLKALEQEKIVPDTAHLNRKSFYEVLDNTTAKIMCSHTCFDAILRHPRNLDQKQLELLCQRKSFVGLAFVSDFLCGKKYSQLADVVRHIDYYVQRFGVDNIGFGTDFFGTENLPKEIQDYKSIYKLVEKLKILGYNNEVINKIFFKNYYDFISS